MGLISALKNFDNKRSLKKLEKIAAKVEDLADKYKDLSDDELKIVIKLFEENNKFADYGCKPSLYVYKYDENKNSWEYDSPLNKSHEQLRGEEWK